MKSIQATRASLYAVLFVGGFCAPARSQDLDRQLTQSLQANGFTGTIQSQLERRLGRKLDLATVDLGKSLFFDRLLGMRGDNACAGCHSPRHGFGDSQSIAIGIENNNLVGPNRAGPRNQRRTPMVLNTAFFPKLMWNSRFLAVSGSPFNNAGGFTFPLPEGATLSYLPHLMTAQAFIPPTERNEMAGFEFPGSNNDIRNEVVRRLNDSPSYRTLFAKAFRSRKDQRITYDQVAAAMAEFQFSLTFADAPLDRFARGAKNALSVTEKRGALLFFGKAGCVSCHAVAGRANEMFSDFTPHAIGVPQVAPRNTNSVFDGPSANEDFGLEQITGNPADRYKFRTSPLRNVGVQPTFFHNGAFTTLEDAVKHHLNPRLSATNYSPVGRLDDDLAGPVGPIAPVLSQLDAKLRNPTPLNSEEIGQLVAFLRNGLLDERAIPARLGAQIPPRLPSGLPPLNFEPRN